MTKIITTTNKDVRSKFLRALRTRTFCQGKTRIISFKEAGRVLSYYRVTKEEMHELLFEWQREGLVKIVPFHGVVLMEGEHDRNKM